MNNEFTERMAQHTDAELIAIVTTKREGYQPEAIEAAETEIEKRNLEVGSVEQITRNNKYEHEKAFELELRKVPSATRFAHVLIDTLCWLVLSFALGFITGMILSFIIVDENLIDIIGFFLTLVGFFLYYIAMEGIWQKTVGKFITKTTVVTTSGVKPSFANIVGRTFCRLLPFDHITFLFMKNGIHDNLSGTMVVKDLVVKGSPFSVGQDLKRY